MSLKSERHKTDELSLVNKGGKGVPHCPSSGGSLLLLYDTQGSQGLYLFLFQSEETVAAYKNTLEAVVVLLLKKQVQSLRGVA